MAEDKEVYIVGFNRTPFLKARGVPGPFSAADLAVAAGRELFLAQNIAAQQVDEVILGCVGPAADEVNIARLVALRLGCGDKVPAYTVQRNCASGMQALDSAYKDIKLGRADLVLAGGTEAMSRAPLIFNDAGTRWFAELFRSKTFGAKIKNLLKIRPKYFHPTIALLQGLTDQYCGLTMPQTAEQLAHEFKISRAEMDEFACMSQHRAAKAQQENLFPEIVSLFGAKDTIYAVDDGVRSDTSLEKLAKLTAITDKKFGVITAGNSSQVTDGSSLLLLASKDAVNKHKLKPVGCIRDVNWAGLRPEVMGLGPVYASMPMLLRHQLNIQDIAAWEINEAFAAQVLACLRAFACRDFCAEHFGMQQAFGKIDLASLNVNGGAIAMGHPVGASGARIVSQLLSVLHKRKQKLGVATICIGGGQGGAMLIEAIMD